METNNHPPKKKSALPAIIIAVVVIAVGAAGYFYYNSTAEPEPDYNKYLDYLSEGDSLVTKNNFTEAKKSYEKSLKYNPHDSAATKKVAKLDTATQLIKKKNAGISHCPTSNFNLNSGVAPVGLYLDKGIKVHSVLLHIHL